MASARTAAIPTSTASSGGQAVEVDVKKREALLHRIQQLIHERVMFAPLLEPAFLSGVGPRVDPATLSLVAGHAFSYPYEDIRLKPRR